jgi:hypothetical protein
VSNGCVNDAEGNTSPVTTVSGEQDSSVKLVGDAAAPRGSEVDVAGQGSAEHDLSIQDVNGGGVETQDDRKPAAIEQMVSQAAVTDQHQEL